MKLKGVGGRGSSSCPKLKSQYTSQLGGKESLLYFRCRHLDVGVVGRVADTCPKADYPTLDKQKVRDFIDRSGGGGEEDYR